MMNPIVKEKWVEALRSEEFKQGRHELCRGNEYCCLGVLLEVCTKLGYKLNKTKSKFYDVEYVQYTYEGESTTAGIPDNLAVELGIKSGGYFRDTFWRMNDNDRMSFPQIANWIEKNL